MTGCAGAGSTQARTLTCALWRLSLAWKPSSFEPGGPIQTRRVQDWVWVWLEASSLLLQTEPWLDASNPEQMDLSRPDACTFGLDLPRSFCVWAGGGVEFGFGSRLSFLQINLSHLYLSVLVGGH